MFGSRYASLAPRTDTDVVFRGEVAAKDRFNDQKRKRANARILTEGPWKIFPWIGGPETCRSLASWPRHGRSGGHCCGHVGLLMSIILWIMRQLSFTSNTRVRLAGTPYTPSKPSLSYDLHIRRSLPTRRTVLHISLPATHLPPNLPIGLEWRRK